MCQSFGYNNCMPNCFAPACCRRIVPNPCRNCGQQRQRCCQCCQQYNCSPMCTQSGGCNSCNNFDYY
uniref:Uncharacterized protein n=1 Tax=Rhabditophanes sp. KR3021 TaxID=114890 RepID=A0AC35TQJ8_9BILA